MFSFLQCISISSGIIALGALIVGWRWNMKSFSFLIKGLHAMIVISIPVKLVFEEISLSGLCEEPSESAPGRGVQHVSCPSVTGTWMLFDQLQSLSMIWIVLESLVKTRNRRASRVRNFRFAFVLFSAVMLMGTGTENWFFGHGAQIVAGMFALYSVVTFVISFKIVRQFGEGRATGRRRKYIFFCAETENIRAIRMMLPISTLVATARATQPLWEPYLPSSIAPFIVPVMRLSELILILIIICVCEYYNGKMERIVLEENPGLRDELANEIQPEEEGAGCCCVKFRKRDSV